MHKSPLPGQPATVASPVPLRTEFTTRRGPKAFLAAVACIFLSALWFSAASQAAEKGAAQDVLLGHDLPDVLNGHTGQDVLNEHSLQDVLKGHGFSRPVQLPVSCHPAEASAPAGSAFPRVLAAGSPGIPSPQEKPPVTSDQPPTQPFDLSDEVVRDILTSLQIGIETHDLTRVLAIFDQQNMPDYAQFRDQMVAFFRRYDSVKFRYQLLQVTADKDGGFAIADIDMDADPSDILPTQQRRSTQMRFQMKRGPKGWKVVALRPADFFNQ